MNKKKKKMENLIFRMAVIQFKNLKIQTSKNRRHYKTKQVQACCIIIRKL